MNLLDKISSRKNEFGDFIEFKIAINANFLMEMAILLIMTILRKSFYRKGFLRFEMVLIG